jgi:hypothetical protein
MLSVGHSPHTRRSEATLSEQNAALEEEVAFLKKSLASATGAAAASESETAILKQVG